MHLLLALFYLSAIPPRHIPKEMYNDYTLGNQIPVVDMYLNDSYSSEQPILFTKNSIDFYLQKAQNRELGYYGATDLYLYKMLGKYPIEGKTVAIIGTVIPWYEAIVLAFGGHPFTIEYNKIVSEDPRVEVTTAEEFERNPRKFDVILSISSIEHDGLGRYGDPVDPHADLETMKKMKAMLNEKGLFFLAVPIGKDALYWNAHRVYGRLRLPLLLEGWKVIDSSGFANSHLDFPGYTHQPVFVLTW